MYFITKPTSSQPKDKICIIKKQTANKVCGLQKIKNQTKELLVCLDKIFNVCFYAGKSVNAYHDLGNIVRHTLSDLVGKTKSVGSVYLKSGNAKLGVTENDVKHLDRVVVTNSSTLNDNVVVLALNELEGVSCEVLKNYAGLLYVRIGCGNSKRSRTLIDPAYVLFLISIEFRKRNNSVRELTSSYLTDITDSSCHKRRLTKCELLLEALCHSAERAAKVSL